MAYGSIKVDNIVFTNAGSDQTVTVSGLVASTSGNITVTGTVSGNIIQGGTLVSGATVTGTTANFTSGNFTNISGGTYTITSGVFAAGSAAAPSISFVSDPNTGIYSPSADQVAISTNGTGRLFVDSSGRVGVNSSTPGSTGIDTGATQLFVVAPNANFGNAATFIADSLGRGILIANQAGTSRIGITPTSVGTNTNDPLVFTTGATERMRLDSSGRLGLGASAPGSLLTLGTTSPTLEFNDSEIGRAHV